MLPQPAGLKDGIDNITPFEFFGEEGDVVLWHGRMYHSATPNYSDQIRQMILYDVMKKSVHVRCALACHRLHLCDANAHATGELYHNEGGGS